MLWHDGQVVASQSSHMQQGHAAALAPMVASVFHDANVSAVDCDRFAVTTGPGSFTGLRVGVSMARGLAIATEKPAVGIDSFRAWAAMAIDGGATPSDAVLVALDSRRGTAFVQIFEGDGVTVRVAAIEYTLERLAEITKALRSDGEVVVTGDILDISERQAYLDLRYISELAAHEITGQSPSPFYLRPPDAKLIATNNS